MATFEVTTYLIIHTKVVVTVQADDKMAASDAAADLLPNNVDMGSARGWKAEIDLKPPKGIACRFVKTTHFEQASGVETVRKVA